MPQHFDLPETAPINLAECLDRLAARGFDPANPDSLSAAAADLKALGSDRTFLGDMVLDRLRAGFRRESEASGAYGAQVIMLGTPNATCFLRANIWPSQAETALRASGNAAFSFEVPHDHNFSFLTHGYFGPGYWSDYYEFDYADLAGWAGESAGLRFTGRRRLEPGRVMLYRAHRDVHAQLPPDALSVSLNVMHTHPAQNWFDQYLFDTADCATGGGGTVAALTNVGAAEVALRMAVLLESESADRVGEAHDLASRFAETHPSDRMRLAAWDALALTHAEAADRDALWARAETGGSRLVAMTAKARRAALTG